MADMQEDSLSVELEETGELVSTGIVSYEIDSDYLTPTDGWSFTVYSESEPAELRRKWAPLQLVKLYLNGNLQVAGRIDGNEGSGSDGALSVFGRDYLAGAVGGGVDPTLAFRKGIGLGDAILDILRPWGITTVYDAGGNLTRNLLTGKQPFSGAPPRDFKSAKTDEFKASEGQGAFELAERLAARHGFTLQPAGGERSRVVLGEPEYRQAPLYRIERGTGSKNVETASARRDYSNVPTVTIAKGRGAGEGAKGVAAIKSQFPTFLQPIGDNTEVQRITAGRTQDTRLDPKKSPGDPRKLYAPLYYQDADSRNVDQLERGVRRMVAERLRDTLTYTCTLRGHSDPDTGAVYAVDTMAEVTDTVDDVEETLWVMSCKRYNRGQGPRTDLVLIRPESFAL